jgi:cell division protein FtsI (penicillin-binding protein 3)
MAVLAAAGLAALVWIAVRLGDVQITRGEELKKKALSQHLDKVELPMDRGAIYDRSGEVLAKSLDCVSLAANPTQIADPDRTAAALAPLLGESPRALRRRMTTGTHFEWLERKVNPEVGRQVDALGLLGIYALPDKERVHPAGRSLAAIVGVTDIDEKGLEGIELSCETTLAGKAGWRVLQCVAGHSSLPTMLAAGRSPEAGQSVVLSIDVRIQEMAELELERAVREHGARKGIAVVIDPDNGDVLAMVAVVGPREAGEVRPTMNLITSLQLEPGSTFKLVAFAAALEARLFRRHDLIDAESGVADLGSLVLRDAHARGLLTFQEAFERSSNICTAKVALRVGEVGFYRTARRFGFGTRTGIDYPGEIPGILRKPRDWSGRSLPTIAIGHEVTVTPLQLACAYAAIANGGVLYEPRLLLRIVDREGRTIRENPPRPVRRVVSEETARVLREFMQGVVVEGTAKGAYLERWTIAGKTGTAYKPAAHGYDRTRVMASFAGFVPAWDPRLAAVVVLDEPSGAAEGGMAAAPAFRAMVERLVGTSPIPLRALGAPIVGPSPSREDFTTWEGFLGTHPPRMMRDEESDGAERVVPGSGEGAPAEVAGLDSIAGGITVPDLFGASLRLAVRALRDAGFDPVVSGTGLVIAQEPEPGLRVQPGTRVTVRATPAEMLVAAATPAAQAARAARAGDGAAPGGRWAAESR